MALFRRLATLATAAEAARRYAKSNPEKAGKFVDQAAAFVDKQTKGRYRTQIDGAAKAAKGAAGIKPTPGYGAAGNGHTPGYGTPTYGTDAPTQAYPQPGTPGYRAPQPGPREHGA
ncbi:MAG: antitoxin [Pseudonocardia sp.]|nr:antitoxin [Pseudonocardia sp.]